MISHPTTYIEYMTPAQVDQVIDRSLYLLQVRGLVIQSEQACLALAEAGAQVDFSTQQVRYPRTVIERALSIAPHRFTLQGRNPQRTVELGTNTLVLCPGYGSAFVMDRQERRPATLADFEHFTALAARSSMIDISGGLLVEPNDVPPALRPLEITRALLEGSDKPLLGSVAGAEGARHTLEIMRIVFGKLNKPVVMGLVNINSPLRLDSSMAGALLAYASEAQPVLLTPGIMLGITAPVSVSGALVQAVAELLGCLALVEAIQPACPVMIGLGGFGANLRSAGSGFGRPENALGAMLGAQVARRLGLPYRCSSGVTGSFSVDSRAGYESMLTAWAAWAGGANLALQAAGTLDCINTMSTEKFILDLEIWSYINRLAKPLGFSENDLALDLLVDAGIDFLSHEHTAHNYKQNIYTPTLIPPHNYDAWKDAGSRDTTWLAQQQTQKLLSQPPPQPVDKNIKAEIDRYIQIAKKHT